MQRVLDRKASRRLFAAAVVGVGMMSTQIYADTYTYTRTLSGTDQWQAGTSWVPGGTAPVSGNATTLTFSGVLAASRVIVSNNNIADNFLLNSLNMQYAGPNTGTAPIVTISGNPLEFVNNDFGPVLTLNTTGTIKPTVAITANMVLTNSLLIAATTNATINNVISGAGRITKTGAGTIAFTGTGSNTFTGDTSITAGILTLGKTAGVTAVSGNLVVSGSTVNLTAADQIADTAAVSLSGSTFGMAANNETVNSFQLIGSTVTGTGTLTSATSFDLQSGTISAILAGSGVGLVKSGGGTVTLAGANTFTGGTTIGAGTLQINAAAGLASTSEVRLTGTSRLIVNAANADLSKVAIGGGVPSGTFLRLNQTQTIGSGPGTISGTLELNAATIGTGYAINLDTGAKVQALVATAFTPTATNLLGDATFDFQTFTSTYNGAISASSSGLKTLTLNADSGVGTVAGVISDGAGSVRLLKIGAGTVAVGSANTYTGATIINVGTLRVGALGLINAASGIGKGSVGGSASDLVFGGGTLQYNGTTGTTSDRLFTIGNANGNTGGFDASGSSAGAITLSNTGNIVLANTAAHTLTLGGTLSPGSSVAIRSVLAPVLTDQSEGNPSNLIKTGAGFWDLTGLNTYSGGTSVQGGVLQSTVAGGMGSGLITVTSGATAGMMGAGTYGNAFIIAGTGSSYTYSGGVGASAGAIRLGNGAEITGPITLSADARISTVATAAAGTAGTISGRITGGFGLQLGSGAGIASAPIVIGNSGNDYTGNTTLLSGAFSTGVLIVRLGVSESIPDGDGKGILILNANNNLTFDLNGKNETVNAISSAGVGTNGNRFITNGGASPSALTIGAGNASASYNGTINNGNGLSVTKIGSGAQTLSGSSGHLLGTRIEGGVLNVDYNAQAASNALLVAGSFSSSAGLTLAGGTFRITGRTDGAGTSEGAVSLSATSTVTLSSTAGLSVGQSVTGDFITPGHYIARIAGNVLTLNSATGTGTGSVTVASADFTTSQTLSTVHVASSSTLDFGAGDSTVMTFNGVSQTEGAFLTIDGWNGTMLTGLTGDRLLFADGVDFVGTFDQNEIQFVGYQAGYTIVDSGAFFEVVPTAVPEPATVSLVALGAIGLLRRRRIRRA